MTLSIMTELCYVECRLRRVPFMLIVICKPCMLSVILLSVVILSAMAPKDQVFWPHVSGACF